MMQNRLRAWSRAALLAALLPVLGSCGEGTVTFGRDDDDDDGNATVTVKGNLDEVTPVTSRDVVVFVYEITDDSDRCPCPPAPPSETTQGKSAVVASGETEFTLTGLDAGPIGVVFLLDNAGSNADGQIDPGDQIAILDDVDCELNDVDGNITVTLEDVDLLFSPAPTTDCTGGDEPAIGRARADEITKAKTTSGN